MKKTLTKTTQLVLVGATLLFSACQKDSVTPGTADNIPVLRPLSAQEVKTVSSSNDFAFRTFSALRAADVTSNMFISPLSISSALTMTYNGADGSNKQAMKETLGFAPQTDTEINESFKTLSDLLTTIDRTVTFTSANSLWHGQQFKLQAPFIQKNTTYFDATVQGLDFSSAGAKDVMNEWVKTKTKGKIENIVKQTTRDDVMFLINAIYFKGAWTYQFDKQLTKPADFHKEDGSSVSVNFMALKNGQFDYYTDSTKQVIELPYGNKQFSMTLVMPVRSKKVADIIPELSSANLANWSAKALPYTAEWRLPKFKMEYEQNLNGVLTQLGMGEAFDEKRADFSQMLQSDSRDLYISDVLHKSFLEVSEEGTEAAAVTSVTIGTTNVSDPRPAVIVIDRPFVFLIRENSTNAILFIGQLMTL